MAVVRQNVSLNPEEFATVEELGAKLGLRFSTALGVIIREWKNEEKLRIVGRAYNAGVITAQELADQVAMLTLPGGNGR